MDLENLKFKVDSKEVLSAFEDLGRLRTQIESLAKPLENLAKATAKVDKALGESADSAKEVQVKTEQLARANQDATEGTNELSNATDKLDKKRKNSIDLLEKENNKLKLIRKERIETVDGIFAMAESLTASQANNLASLATKGASTQYLNLLSDVYNNINKVLGANPFDQSTDGVAKLKRELSDLNKVEEYARQGYNLTGKQLGYLSTSLEKIEQSYKAMGKSEADILQAQKAMESEFITHLGQLQDKQKVSYQMNQQSKETTRALEKETKATSEYNKQLAIFNEYKDVGFSDEIAKKATQMRMKGINADTVYEYAGKALQEETIKAEQEKAKLQERNHQEASMMMQQATEQFRAENEKKEASQRKVNEQLAIEAKAMQFQAQGYQRGESVRGARSIVKGGIDENTVKQTLAQAKASREALKEDKALAKSRAYLEEETARVENAVSRLTDAQHNNTRMGAEMSSNLDKYAKHLERVGITGEEASKKLQKYKDSLSVIDEGETKRKTDYLARSLSPQISDIAVSLYGGMSPMTVLAQQGLQIRDMIGQVGLEADQVNGAMRQAGSEFVRSIGNTLTSTLGLAFGAFRTIGDGFLGMVNRINPLRGSLQTYMDYLRSTRGEQDLVYTSLNAIVQGISIGFAGVLAGITTALVFYAFQVYDASKAHDALVKSIAETGGAFGMTAGSIMDSSKALATEEVTARALSEAFVEISKYSTLAGQDIEAIALASATYADASGKAVGDVIKQYQELAKDPVKSLQELGSVTGDVTLATIDQVKSLVDQGRQYEAVELAVKTLTKSFNKSTQDINENLSETGKFLKLIGDKWDTYWSKVKGVGNIDSYKEQLSNLEGRLNMAKADSLNALLEGGTGTLEKEITRVKGLIKVKTEQLAVEKRNSELAIQSAEIDKIEDQLMSKKEKITKAIAKSQGAVNVETAKGITANKAYIEAHKKLIASNEEELKQLAEKEAKDAQRKAKEGAGAKPKKEAKSEAERYRDKVDTESTRVIDNLRKAYEGLYAKEYELLPIERELNKIRTDPQYKDYNAQDKKAIDNLGRKSLVQAILNELDKDAEKVKKQINDQEEKRIELSNRALDTAQANLNSYNESLQQEADNIQFEISLLGKSAEEQTRLTNIRNEYVKSTAILLALEKQRADIQPQDKAKFEALIAEASARINESSARGNAKTDLEKQKKAFDELKAKQEEFTNGFADAMATAILEGGSAGATKLKDLMKQMFIREPIKVLMQGLFKDILGGGSGSSATPAGSAGSSLGSLGSMLGNLFSSSGSNSGGSASGGLFNTITDGVKSLFSSGGSANAVGTNSIETAMKAASQAQVSANLADSTRMLGNALQGFAMGSALNNALSGGFKVSNGVSTLQNIGAGVAGALGGPLMGALVGAGSAIFNRAFGRKLVGEGYMGSFANGNVSTMRYKEEKGGWFRSDKMTKTALSKREEDVWNMSFKGMQQGAIAMANAFGIGGEALKTFTGDVKVNLKGLSAEEATKKIQEEFNNIQRTMLQTIPAFEDFAYAGETAGKAFDKLMADVRNSLDAVGVTTENIAGILLENMTGNATAEEAGKALSDNVIGGIYKSIASSYAQGISQMFMSGIIQPVMSAVLAGIPVAQAISQEAIQAVVGQAQASAQALGAILNDPSFRQAMASIQQAIGGVVGATSGVATSPYVSNPQAEKNKQDKASLTRQILELTGNTTALRAEELKGLSKGNQALQKRIWLLEDEKKREDERSALEKQLLQVQGKTQRLRELELEALDPANRALQQQIWSLEAAEKLKDVWKDVVDSLSEEIQRLKDNILGTSPNAEDSLQNKFNELTKRALSGDSEAGQELAKVSQTLLEQKKNESSTLAEYLLAQSSILGSLEATRATLNKAYGLTPEGSSTGGSGANNPSNSWDVIDRGLERMPSTIKNPIKGYATGGYHSGGLAIVGEQGAELVNLPPSTINTNTQTKSMLGSINDALVNEVIALRNEVSMLRVEVRADVVTNTKTTKILERVTRSEDAIYTIAG